MNFFKSTTLALAGTLAFTGMAQATTVLIGTDAGTASNSPTEIRDDTGSRGADFDGATITATFNDGSMETVVWGALDAFTRGEARGDNFALYMDFEGFDPDGG